MGEIFLQPLMRGTRLSRVVHNSSRAKIDVYMFMHQYTKAKTNVHAQGEYLRLKLEIQMEWGSAISWPISLSVYLRAGNMA